MLLVSIIRPIAIIAVGRLINKLFITIKYNIIMKKYTIRPYDDYKSWGDYDTIEEARKERSKLAMSFFSRSVVIIDNTTGKEIC